MSLPFTLLVFGKEDLNNIPESQLVVDYMLFEGIPLVVEDSAKALVLSRGTRRVLVLDPDGGVIGGFYDLVDYVQAKGLTRC